MCAYEPYAYSHHEANHAHERKAEHKSQGVSACFLRERLCDDHLGLFSEESSSAPKMALGTFKGARSTEGSPAQVSPAQVSLVQKSPAQVSPAQGGTIQGGSLQVNAAQVGFLQVGPAQVSLAQVSL